MIVSGCRYVHTSYYIHACVVDTHISLQLNTCTVYVFHCVCGISDAHTTHIPPDSTGTSADSEIFTSHTYVHVSMCDSYT